MSEGAQHPVAMWLADLTSLPRRLLGAVVVGVATLFQPKADPTQHWSIPPTFPVEDQTSGDLVNGKLR